MSEETKVNLILGVFGYIALFVLAVLFSSQLLYDVVILLTLIGAVIGGSYVAYAANSFLKYFGISFIILTIIILLILIII